MSPETENLQHSSLLNIKIELLLKVTWKIDLDELKMKT